jgi:hypothetical protein
MMNVGEKHAREERMPVDKYLVLGRQPNDELRSKFLDIGKLVVSALLENGGDRINMLAS